MTTFTQTTPAALDEAAAIVEAEWMRLQRQGAIRVRRPGPPSARLRAGKANSDATFGGDALARN